MLCIVGDCNLHSFEPNLTSVEPVFCLLSYFMSPANHCIFYTVFKKSNMSDGGKELHGKQRNVSSLLPEEIVSAISALRDGGRREPRKLLSLDAKLVHYSGDEKLNTGAIVQASVYRHDEHNNAVSVGAMTREIVEEVCPA